MQVCYEGKAINAECPGNNEKFPEDADPTTGWSSELGPYKLCADPLDPQKDGAGFVYGYARVKIEVPESVPSPAHVCGFAAIFLEEEVETNDWQLVPDEDVYAGESPEINLDWTYYPTWKGWKSVPGRRYRTCVLIQDAWERKEFTSDRGCSNELRWPQDFNDTEINPLALHFPEYFVRINLPYPLPFDVLKARLQKRVSRMTPMQRREALQQVKSMRSYTEILEQVLVEETQGHSES